MTGSQLLTLKNMFKGRAMPESWVFGANDPMLGRGLNHLPFVAFDDPETGRQRLGVGIGACVLDLVLAAPALPAAIRQAVAETHLNALMKCGPAAWAELRHALQTGLARTNRDHRELEAALLPERVLNLVLPVKIGDYTDFYASRHHARRVGELFRPDRPLLENYDWVPVAYHGRASSIVASGTPVRRPWGQRRGAARPVFVSTAQLDYEVELGLWVGVGNALGEPVPIGRAASHLFGVSLLNDWSARDIQAWEYQPLGPFLGKNFCTSVSPWITPIAALESCRTVAVPHSEGLLEYLHDEQDQSAGGFAIDVRASLSTAQSRAAGLEPFPLSEANSDSLYWTPAQMVAHHTSGGCNLRAGDLLGTGTISGPGPQQAGCLLELTQGGAHELVLPNGERRRFLADGDELRLAGWCRPNGAMPLRFGDCSATCVA